MILKDGELFIEYPDAGIKSGSCKAKIGDGITTYDKLPYSFSGGGSAPIGTIISYMGTIAPDGFLICNGATYQIADYPQLVDHFIKNFGRSNYFGGNGTTTFAVPDLRGEFLRGSGTAARNTGSGAAVGVHQGATYHPYIQTWRGQSNGDTWVGGYCVTDGNNSHYNQDAYANYSSFGISVAHNSPNTSSGYKNQPLHYSSRPTNTAVLYCICASAEKKSDVKPPRTIVEPITLSMTTAPSGNQIYFKIPNKEGYAQRMFWYMGNNAWFLPVSGMVQRLNKSMTEVHMWVSHDSSALPNPINFFGFVEYESTEVE